jgi:hypothetical protein
VDFSTSTSIDKERYALEVEKNNIKLKLQIIANDASHAQAQVVDIARALQADKYQLQYGHADDPFDRLSDLFKKLAFSEFEHTECAKWTGSKTNQNPVVYIFEKRYYVRPLILDYMDIKRDNIVKMECESKDCVNPYHFSYKKTKASKMSSGDLKMMLAFRSQGVSVSQIAKALNLHRSTVYRNLNHERLHAGP